MLKKTEYYPQSSCDCQSFCQPKAFKHSVEPSNETNGGSYLSPPYNTKTCQNGPPHNIDFISNLEYQHRAQKVTNGVYGPFTSTDPRLKSEVSGLKSYIDKPPLQCNINMDNLEQNTCSTGNNWKSYNDIDLGNIVYYNDKTIEDALFTPLFSTQASVEGIMYKDPMGTIKPQYTRCPLPTEECDNSLSWIRDSQEHRQDLMSLQMRKQNQYRWAPLYTPSSSKKYNINTFAPKKECVY